MKLKLNVSTRIFGGFALVLILSIATFVASILGINAINAGMQDVTVRSVPMLESSAKLSNSLLQSQATLLDLFNSDKLDYVEKTEQSFIALKSTNQEAQKELVEFTKDLPELNTLFSKSVTSTKGFYSAAETMLGLHKQVLKGKANVTETATEFADMADEIVSFTYDLEGIASSESSQTLILELTEELENTVEYANSALGTAIKFEVMSVQGIIKNSVNSIADKLNQAAISDDLAGSEELDSINEAFVRFKAALVDSNNVLQQQLAVLKVREESLKSLDQARTVSETVLQDLTTFGQAVSAFTGTIKEEAAKTVNNSQTLILVMAAIVIGISLAISFYVTKSIQTPLTKAVKNIRQVSTGDLTVDFGKHGNDELGILTSNMQDLVNNLRSILNDITESSNVLATSVEETSTICEHSFDNVMKQKEQTTLVTESLAEMAESVSSVSESINQTLEVVETAHSEVSKGETLLNSNIGAIKNLDSSIESASEVIGQLNEETNNIGSVLEVISGVAEQTNLLALNAAIEAARAGEQGRGFAVVADEVRTLASRSHDSTAEIHQLIERLLEGVGKAVKTMEQSQTETKQCVEGINNVGSMLTSISHGIDNIKSMSETIASAAEEQSVAADTQKENVEAIAGLAEQTASSAQENREAGHQLAELAERQRELVGRFTI